MKCGEHVPRYRGDEYDQTFDGATVRVSVYRCDTCMQETREASDGEAGQAAVHDPQPEGVVQAARAKGKDRAKAQPVQKGKVSRAKTTR